MKSMTSENSGNKGTKVRSKILTIAIVTFVLTMSFAVLFANGNAATQPSGTYIWGTPVSTPVTDLNPLVATNLAGEATAIMYPTSLLYPLSDGSLIPWLAENYTISSNGLVYTFNLVHNATWMNGTSVAGPITAQDVAFTFNVLKANSTLDSYGVDPYVKSVTAVNNYTVQFVLNSSSIMMLTYLATQTIIPAAWGPLVSNNLSAIGGYNNLDTPHQLQAGPFILQSASETSMNFVANTHFWMGVPHILNLIVEPFKSTSAMTLSFQSGAIDAEYPAISDYAALSTTSNVVNNIYKEPWSYFLWDNTQVAPYNNTSFRQGLAYAINKTQIMQKAEDGIGGSGSFGGEPWTNTSWWAAGLPDYKYNTTLATQSFEAAGLTMKGGFWTYPNGTAVQIKIVDPPVSDWTTAASFIANDLGQAGFQVTESIVPFSTWATDMFHSKVSQATDVISYFGATPSYSNAWYVLQDLYSYNSFWAGYITHWNNQTVNNIFNQTATLVNNNTLLLQKLAVAQRIIAQQVPMVLIGDVGNYYAYNDQKITGFVANEPPDGTYNLIRISVPSSVTTTPTSTIPSYVYALIVVVVLIVVIVPIVYVMSKRGKAKKTEEAPSTQPQEPEKKT